MDLAIVRQQCNSTLVLTGRVDGIDEVSLVVVAQHQLKHGGVSLDYLYIITQSRHAVKGCVPLVIVSHYVHFAGLRAPMLVFVLL